MPQRGVVVPDSNARLRPIWFPKGIYRFVGNREAVENADHPVASRHPSIEGNLGWTFFTKCDETDSLGATRNHFQTPHPVLRTTPP